MVCQVPPPPDHPVPPSPLLQNGASGLSFTKALAICAIFSWCCSSAFRFCYLLLSLRAETFVPLKYPRVVKGPSLAVDNKKGSSGYFDSVLS